MGCNTRTGVRPRSAVREVPHLTGLFVLVEMDPRLATHPVHLDLSHSGEVLDQFRHLRSYRQSLHEYLDFTPDPGSVRVTLHETSTSPSTPTTASPSSTSSTSSAATLVHSELEIVNNYKSVRI